ncbi:MAG: hypothetical protein Q7S71_05280 [Candidatus Nitrotoga sp.]|nr:hypothetical protein [Candidatus Nitrotoga sp.]
MAIGTGAAKVWYHDPHVWRFVFARYLPALAVLSALWEIAQLPLYTLWWETPPASIVYAVFHCTLGDVLIGVAALLAALIATRAGALRDWHWIQVGAITATFSLSYTVFSEWFNTTVLTSWTYSEWMPLTPFVPIGVSPLLQWVVVPLAALAFSRRIA